MTIPRTWTDVSPARDHGCARDIPMRRAPRDVRTNARSHSIRHLLGFAKRLSWNSSTSKTSTKHGLHVRSACMGSCDSHGCAIGERKGVTSAERVQINAWTCVFGKSHAIGIPRCSRHAADTRFQASLFAPLRGMRFCSTKGYTHDKHEGPNECGLREASAAHDEKGSAHATLHRPREWKE